MKKLKKKKGHSCVGEPHTIHGTHGEMGRWYLVYPSYMTSYSQASGTHITSKLWEESHTVEAYDPFSWNGTKDIYVEQ